MWHKNVKEIEKNCKWNHRKYLCSCCTSARWKFRRKKRKTVKISLGQRKVILKKKSNYEVTFELYDLGKKDKCDTIEKSFVHKCSKKCMKSRHIQIFWHFLPAVHETGQKHQKNSTHWLFLKHIQTSLNDSTS